MRNTYREASFGNTESLCWRGMSERSILLGEVEVFLIEIYKDHIRSWFISFQITVYSRNYFVSEPSDWNLILQEYDAQGWTTASLSSSFQLRPADWT